MQVAVVQVAGPCRMQQVCPRSLHRAVDRLGPGLHLRLCRSEITPYGCAPLIEGLAMAAFQHLERIDWDAIIGVVFGCMAGSALWGILG